MNGLKRTILLLGAIGAGCASAAAQPNFPVFVQEGRLTYEKADAQGNRVPDYSYCGYRHSEEPIPDARAVVRVAPVEGDNSARLQAAIDYVASLAPDARGLRGAVLLEEGTTRRSGSAPRASCCAASRSEAPFL